MSVTTAVSTAIFFTATPYWKRDKRNGSSFSTRDFSPWTSNPTCSTSVMASNAPGMGAEYEYFNCS